MDIKILLALLLLYFLVGCSGLKNRALEIVYINQDYRVMCYDQGRQHVLSSMENVYPYPFLISDSSIYILPSKHFMLKNEFTITKLYCSSSDKEVVKYNFSQGNYLKIMNEDTVFLGSSYNGLIRNIDDLLLYSHQEEIDPIHILRNGSTTSILHDDFSNYVTFKDDTIRLNPPYRFKYHYFSQNKKYWVGTVVKSLKEDYARNSVSSMAVVYNMVSKRQEHIIEFENLKAAQISDDGKFLLISQRMKDSELSEFSIYEIGTGKINKVGNGYFATLK